MLHCIQNISLNQNSIKNHISQDKNLGIGGLYFTGGVNNLCKVSNSQDLDNLVLLYQNSLNHSLKGKILKPSKFSIVRKFQNLMQKISAFPYKFSAKQTDSITEVIKNSDGKVLAGYTMFPDKSQKCMYIGLSEAYGVS